MADTMATPGWYYAEGDPPGTQRYWDGATWTHGPVAAPSAVATTGFPAAPPQLHDTPVGAEESRLPWEWWWHVLTTSYADFDGRARRSEFWWFYLTNMVLLLAIFLPAFVTTSSLGTLSAGLGIVFVLGTVIPTLAATVRRLHDTGRSGWWYVATLIPIVNYVTSIIVLVFLFLDGNPHDNNYGADPKRRG